MFSTSTQILCILMGLKQASLVSFFVDGRGGAYGGGYDDDGDDGCERGGVER